jgi:hypothetical protein
MNLVELSVFIFGIYVAVVAVTFVFVPNMFLKLFRFEPTTEPWIRVLGIIVAILAYYYIHSALVGIPDFFWITVWGRFALLPSLVLLVLVTEAKPQLIIFGLVDAGFALWTLLALL